MMTVAYGQEIPGTTFSIRVQRGGYELVEQVTNDWQRLCDASGDEEVFYRPEWAQAYLQAFEPKADVIIISAWAGDKLRGILPLVRRRTVMSGLPIVQLTLPANVHSLRASLTVCRGEQGEAALKALWQAVKDLPHWDALDVANVVEGSGLDRLTVLAQADGYRTARKRTSQTLYLPINPSTTDKPGQPPWLVGTRPKFRSQLRRAKRQLEEQGTLEVKHYSAADPEALEKFYTLEASGWKGAERTAIKCDPRTRQFYDAIAQAVARDGYLSLDFLELNGKPIAGHFGFNLRGRYFLAKAGYDEAFRRYGPGQLLVNEILAQTPERGLREFDFVGPATWDESRWASARRTNYRVFIFRKNLYGALLYAARISARDAVRRLLGRRENESAPLELKSKPQGSENDSATDQSQ
ncbi:MAG TPA: GNAT family N-acetyltransferase [Candidatus Angelobacter sp.]|jgi:CelD/BcsL family acetyltransferase involved in cellulose biosynthesis|nr:GNAT family N-acetyltransferase [Candidatus Angelobacter sp.]